MAGVADIFKDFRAHNAFDQEIADLVRARRHDEADRRLGALLAEVPGEIAEACRGIPAEAVRIVGWEEANVRIETLSKPDAPITALGIDISYHGEAFAQDGSPDQPIETNYYADVPNFAFSSADDAALLAASAKCRGPWKGCFIDIDGAVRVEGLAPLYACLTMWPRSTESVEAAARILGEHVRHLRVHQAVRRALADVPLARPIPIIVGTNECSPFYEAAYRPAKIADYAPAAARRREEERATLLAQRAKATEQTIATWREQRAKVLGWGGDLERRIAYVNLVNAMEAVTRVGTPLVGLPHGYELNDAAFERMLEAYRRHRLA